MTRVIGLMSIWDESATWLASSIASLARFCDHVVLLDGRYALYPDQRLQSGMEQHEACIDAARGAGIGITLHTAPFTYEDEMVKRTKLFQLGMCEATMFDDWFFVLDGDEMICESLSKESLLSTLDGAKREGVDVLTSTLFERTDPHSNEWRTSTGMKLESDWRYESASPRFWRVLNNMRVVGYHYNYVGENETGETVELWGNEEAVKNPAKKASLCGKIIIENRNRLRGKMRDRDRQDYYETRDELEAEKVLPLHKMEEVA